MRKKLFFFLNCFVSSEHPLGSRILDLGKNLKSKTEKQFLLELRSVVDFLTDYLKTTIPFKNFFRINFKKLENLFTKLRFYDINTSIPAVIETFWQICTYFDENLVENPSDFYQIFQSLLSKASEILRLNSYRIIRFLQYDDLNTQEYLEATGLYQHILNCCFHPYETDLNLGILDVFMRLGSFTFLSLLMIERLKDLVRMTTFPIYYLNHL